MEGVEYRNESPAMLCGERIHGTEQASKLRTERVDQELRELRRLRIYWVDLNRFDIKPNKSTWIEMADALSYWGYCTTILTGFGKKVGAAQIGDAAFHYFRAVNYRFLFRISLMLNMLTWLIRHAGKEDIVVLTPPTLYMAPFLRLLGIRKIHLDVRTVPVEVGTLKGRLNRIMGWSIPIRLFQHFAAGYSFITERLKREVEREFALSFAHWVIWSSGVNASRFDSAVRTQPQVLESKYILFYHGTLTANRGIDRVIMALPQLAGRIQKDLRFVVVGNGPALDYLIEVANKYGVSGKVDFKGLVPYESIPMEINAADCCICPLPDRPEWNVSSPLKVFEYMACGKPIILTPIPAHKDVLGDEDFVVWTKGDGVDHFAEAIERAIQKDKELAVAAGRGRELAREEFDWLGMGRRLARYLDQTLGKL